jgi:hypothetical protein
MVGVDMIWRLARFVAVLWLGIAIGVFSAVVVAMWSVAKGADE